MDTAAFRADLVLIPETLDALADALDEGLPGLERLPVLGASRVLVLGMGSSRYAADVVARRFRAIGATVVVELASAELLPPAAPTSPSWPSRRPAAAQRCCEPSSATAAPGGSSP